MTTGTLGHKNDLAYDLRMSGNGFLRALAGQHIRLDKDLLAGFNKTGYAPYRFKQQMQGVLHSSGVIIG
jgi:hypothetical protein